jgi:hypothetical protein
MVGRWHAIGTAAHDGFIADVARAVVILYSIHAEAQEFVGIVHERPGPAGE